MLCHQNFRKKKRKELEREVKKQLYMKQSLLRIDTVAMDRKSLWSQATRPSLLKHRYSGSSVVIDVFCSSLLWLLVEMNEVTSSTHRY
jgi:hypothetical protein